MPNRKDLLFRLVSDKSCSIALDASETLTDFDRPGGNRPDRETDVRRLEAAFFRVNARLLVLRKRGRVASVANPGLASQFFGL